MLTTGGEGSTTTQTTDVGDDTGIETTGSTTGDVTDASCDEAGDDAGSSVLRRLSRIEYQLTMQDLFELEAAPDVGLIPQDVEQEGFTTFSALQSVSAAHLRAYLETVSVLFDDLAEDEARLDSVIGCEFESPNCLETFAMRFGRRAYRRALSETELADLMALAEEHGNDAMDQFRYVAQALLISPDFLFRVEVGDSNEALSNLTAEELASKLSFTIWGRGPSESLLDQAEIGDLSEPTALAAIVDELLADPKAEYFYQEFFRQWLGYGSLRAPIEPPADWSDDLMSAMTEETDTLIAEFAWEPQKHLFDVLTANHSTMSPDLAAFYGVQADAGGQVTFTPEEPRYGAGLLGHASILSQKTDGDKVSVRGNWLRRTFICEELEIPAGLAEVLGEQLVGLTSMEIIAERNEEAACANCHSKIDPIGVGLAQFDATGRFDATVDLSTYPIAPGFPDAPEPEFTSLSDLARKLRAMPEISECLTERAFIYMLGRHAEQRDVCGFEEATLGFAADGGSFVSLLRHLVLSPSFALRRAPTTP